MDEHTKELIKTYEYCEDQEHMHFKDSTYDIVSKIAYLIGVPKRIFELEAEPPKLDIYERLEKDKAARIIRNLCLIRTTIIQKFAKINSEIKRSQSWGLYSMPEMIPQDALQQLERDGASFYRRSSLYLSDHIIEINRLIRDRINNCKGLFPVWLNWEYVRELFNMKNGLTTNGVKLASSVFYNHKSLYPYITFINWDPQPNGNILYNDKKFVTLLYQWHNDYFADYSKVSDASSYVKSSIYGFIDDAEKVVMVVDCENADPYSFSAALKGLDAEFTKKISKIMLFDDVLTVEAWRFLESHTSIPVDHIMTERVKQSKSLVDIELTVMTCREHYLNRVDSFILVSSDSDYWGLISNLPDAKFLVMIERENCGPDLKAAMANSGIFYCYIDDFYTGDSESLKKNALFNELYRSLDKAVKFNAWEMFESALVTTRIDMDPASKRQFYEKHIRAMKLVIDDTGNVSVELKK